MIGFTLHVLILFYFTKQKRHALYQGTVSSRPESDLKLSDLLMFCHERFIPGWLCIMMWKMSGMKLYLALSRWECVCAYGRIISWQFQRVVTKSLHPTFQAQFSRKATFLLHVSGEFGSTLCEFTSTYPSQDFW